MAARRTDNWIPSLFKTCTERVVKNLKLYEDDLSETSMPVKEACLNLMCKRGLVTDDNLAKVICNKTRILDLSACDVSDVCLLNIPTCRNLHKVDLNANKEPNKSITSAGLASLSQSCPHLQILYLRRCINLTDDGVVAVSQNCPKLRELNAGGCELLTDASLQALGQNSGWLTSLNISKTAVTDQGIFQLANGICSPSLKELNMSGCQKLTDEAVEAVSQMCPKIRILLFHQCPLITENAWAALEELSHNGAVRMQQVTFTL